MSGTKGLCHNKTTHVATRLILGLRTVRVIVMSQLCSRVMARAASVAARIVATADAADSFPLSVMSGCDTRCEQEM